MKQRVAARLVLLLSSVGWSSCGGRAEKSFVEAPDMGDGEPSAETSSGGAEANDPPLVSSGGSPPDTPPIADECTPAEGTDLLWEPLSDDPSAPNYRAATYTWFDPNEETNGGDEGLRDGGACAYSPCDTTGRLEWTNGFRPCGLGDWRMPTVDELLLLAEEGDRPLDGSEPFYWSSQALDDEAALGAYLCCGGVVAPSVKDGAGFVRLVHDVE